MKAIAFRSKVKGNGTIQIPKQSRRSIKKGDEVRVVLLWPESEDDASLWEDAAARTFLEGDGQSDVLYDKL
jgi:bifunctional DNA-binding transcriptional regulator/antitoxin component of YhaV-PrlF toxin-antitoxin module